MNKTIVTIIIVVIIILGGYFLLRSPESPTPAPSSGLLPQQSSQKTPQTPQTQTTQAPVILEASLVSQNVVTYTDAGYSPNPFKIEVGETVTFKNNSSQSMWTASGIHPTHALYPTTGGCLGSTFDACKGIQPGDSWSFKFDIAGSWKYHNHLNPSNTGTIIVE